MRARVDALVAVAYGQGLGVCDGVVVDEERPRAALRREMAALCS